MFSIDYRKLVIEANVAVLRKLGMQDKTIAFFMRACHVHAPIYILIHLANTGKTSAIITIALMLLTFAYFVLFDGCVLSKIEFALDHEDITIVDPFLEMAGYEKNKQNRINLSIMFGIGYVLFAILIIELRFYSS